MRAQISCCAMLFLVVTTCQLQAQQVDSPGISVQPFGYITRPAPELTLVAAQDKGKEKDKDKGKAKTPKKDTKAPIEPKQQPVDAFAPETASAPEATSGFNPTMLGDLPGAFSLQTVMLPATQIIQTFQFTTTFTTVQQINPNGTITTRQVPVTTQTPITIQRIATVPVVTRIPQASFGASKVAENQSPMPQDRGYLTYNYYTSVGGPTGPVAAPQQTTFNGAPATVTTLTPASPRIDIQRGVVGFEKRFLDGNASVSVRIPFFGGYGGDINQSSIGDISVFLNLALYRDAAGNVLASGIGLTVPTGPAIDTIAGNVNPYLIQPFVGYRRSLGDFYVQGFSSLAVPTDVRIVTIMYNDIGVGYWVYRGKGDKLITAVIPTFEVHVTTPLNHRQPTDLITTPDIVALTSGVHFGLGNRSLLTFGAVVPVTGPLPWSIEAICQLNVRF